MVLFVILHFIYHTILMTNIPLRIQTVWSEINQHAEFEMSYIHIIPKLTSFFIAMVFCSLDFYDYFFVNN